MSVKAKAAGTCLIDKFQCCGLAFELSDEFVNGIDAVHDLALVADFSIMAICGNGHINGFLMNIHSDHEPLCLGAHKDGREYLKSNLDNNQQCVCRVCGCIGDNQFVVSTKSTVKCI
jgi:hypothetical protein